MDPYLEEQLNRIDDKLDRIIMYLEWAHPGLSQPTEVIQGDIQKSKQKYSKR